MTTTPASTSATAPTPTPPNARRSGNEAPLAVNLGALPGGRGYRRRGSRRTELHLLRPCVLIRTRRYCPEVSTTRAWPFALVRALPSTFLRPGRRATTRVRSGRWRRVTPTRTTVRRIGVVDTRRRRTTHGRAAGLGAVGSAGVVVQPAGITLPGAAASRGPAGPRGAEEP